MHLGRLIGASGCGGEITCEWACLHAHIPTNTECVKICSALSHLYENYIIFRKEFERALYTMGMRMREDEYDALFTMVDKDGSGTVVANCCAV